MKTYVLSGHPQYRPKTPQLGSQAGSGREIVQTPTEHAREHRHIDTRVFFHVLVMQLIIYTLDSCIGQRLAAQKGDSDDLVGVMKAQGEPVSDDED
jgi:hypothetical protein